MCICSDISVEFLIVHTWDDSMMDLHLAINSSGVEPEPSRLVNIDRSSSSSPPEWSLVADVFSLRLDDFLLVLGG